MEAGIIRTVVLREDATYDIFVELDAKGVRDLLGDAQVAEFGVAGLRGCGVSSSRLPR